MKPPTLNKARREWLESLKDGADHQVVHVAAAWAHATERTVRWWADLQVLADVMPTTRGDRMGSEYTKSGFADERRQQRDWIEPLTDEYRRMFLIRRLRDILMREPTWRRATDEQVIACAALLGIE